MGPYEVSFKQRKTWQPLNFVILVCYLLSFEINHWLFIDTEKLTTVEANELLS